MILPLTEKRPVCAVTAVATERSLTVVSHRFPQHGTGLSWHTCPTSDLPATSVT